MTTSWGGISMAASVRAARSRTAQDGDGNSAARREKVRRHTKLTEGARWTERAGQAPHSSRYVSSARSRSSGTARPSALGGPEAARAPRRARARAGPRRLRRPARRGALAWRSAGDGRARRPGLRLPAPQGARARVIATRAPGLRARARSRARRRTPLRAARAGGARRARGRATRPPPRSRSARRSRSGAGRRSRTSSTSRSRRRRSRGSRSCAPSSSRSGSTPISRSAATPSSSPSSRRSSRPSRCASARARSSCSRSTARAGRPTRSPPTAQARETLVEELGIDPGPELRELEAAILRQDDVAAPRGDAARAAGDAVPAARHDPLRRRRRVDGARGGARPGGARRASCGATSRPCRRRSRATEARSRSTRATRSWPRSGSRSRTRTTRCAPRAPRSTSSVGIAALNEQLVHAARRRARGPDRDRDGGGRRDADGRTPAARHRRGGRDRRSKLEASAGADEIVVGELAARLIDHAARLEPLGELEIKGQARPVGAFRLVELEQSRPRSSGGSTLRSSVASASSRRCGGRSNARSTDRRCGSRWSIGSAGGREVAARGRAHTPREGGHDALGTLPLLRRRHHVLAAARGARARRRESDERDAILAALEAETPPPAPEIAWLFRRFCEASARGAAARPRLRRRPLGGADVPRARRAPRGQGRGADSRRLPRARGAARRRVPTFLDGRAKRRPRSSSMRSRRTRPRRSSTGSAARILESDQRTRIVEAAEGNPLFLEQLLALALEGGLDRARVPGDDPGAARRAPRPARPRRARRARARRGRREGVHARTTSSRCSIRTPRRPPTRTCDARRPRLRAAARRRRVRLSPRARAGGGLPRGPEAPARGAARALRRPARHGVAGSARARRVRRLPPRAGVSACGPSSASRIGGRSGWPRTAGGGWARLVCVPRSAATCRRPSALLRRATSLLPPVAHARTRAARRARHRARGAGDTGCGRRAYSTSAIERASAAGDRRVELRARMELEYVRIAATRGATGDALLEAAAAAIPVFEAAGDDRCARPGLASRRLGPRWPSRPTRGAAGSGRTRARSLQALGVADVDVHRRDRRRALLGPDPGARGDRSAARALLETEALDRYGRANVERVSRRTGRPDAGSSRRARELIESARSDLRRARSARRRRRRSAAAILGTSSSSRAMSTRLQTATLRWLCEELERTQGLQSSRQQSRRPGGGALSSSERLTRRRDGWRSRRSTRRPTIIDALRPVDARPREDRSRGMARLTRRSSIATRGVRLAETLTR